jgi:hypothetical protein
VTLRRSPYLEMGISLMTDVLVAAVMVWILFRKKVCTVACCVYRSMLPRCLRLKPFFRWKAAAPQVPPPQWPPPDKAGDCNLAASALLRSCMRARGGGGCVYCA